MVITTQSQPIVALAIIDIFQKLKSKSVHKFSLIL